jgi:hypothetical protein
MTSYLFDIGGKRRAAARFIGHVRSELQRALVAEKATRKITQQAIAKLLGVNRSVINRQLMGFENMTLRRVAELAWALGWEIVFELRKPTPVLLVSNPITDSNLRINLSVSYALVCDDIRREDTGKLIFIGVYGRDIRVTSVPASLVLSLAVSAMASKPLDTDVEIRWSTDGHEQGKIKGHLVVGEPGAALMATSGIAITDIKKDSNIIFEWRAPNGNWQKIYSVPVVVAKKQA